MSTSLTGLTTNFFPSAQNGFTTTLASTISSGATTVPLNSVAGYTNGQVAVFVIDPSNATLKQTFTGVIDTAGIQVTNVIWTAGTNQTHTGGATVVDYATATHISMITKGLLITHDQGGLNRSGAAYPSPVFSGTATGTYTLGGTPTINNPAFTGVYNGWVTGLATPNTITANGNRSYSLVFNATDLTGTLSPGMRLRTTRSTLAPTQCTSLNGTTQFWSKTSPAGMTFTNNFVVSAWVKLSSYAAAGSTIASRYNGTSGWTMVLLSTGQVQLAGFNAGAGNVSYVLSYQSVPLNKWVHISAQLDMATFTATPTTSYVMIDGVDVPASVVRAGTNPTALVQAGNLEIGSQNTGGLPFPGKIAQVAIYSAKVTEATILASMHQGLLGTETNNISVYSFSSSANDIGNNGNNLTANGSATATNADSPFGGQAGGAISTTLDYGIVQSVAFSTNTTVVVQVPEGCTIPTSGGVSAVSYSGVKAPYGMPVQKGKWAIEMRMIANQSQATPAANTWYNIGSQQLLVPIGEWAMSYNTPVQSTAPGGTGSVSQLVTLATAAATQGTISEFNAGQFINAAAANSLITFISRSGYQSVAAAQSYFLNYAVKEASAGTIAIQSSYFSVTNYSPSIILAENALL